MKLKCLPTDFQVEELTSVAPADGRFGLYELRKQSLGTLEAVQAIARRWRLAPARISFGGLKDKHAVTRQYLTIAAGPRRNLRQSHLRLTYLGQVVRPFESTDVQGNRFRLAVRDLSRDRADEASNALPEAVRTGVPNYFDRQRFGSVGQSGQFVAQAWCLGNYERSLWLAVADTNRHDRPEQRREKELWRNRWGDWQACTAGTRDPIRRGVLAHLLGRPGDFRGAFARIDPRLRGLYVAAFQSHLWNQLLARFLRATCNAEMLADMQLDDGCYPFFRAGGGSVPEELGAVSLPLPSARLHGIDESMRPLLEQVVGEAGLALRQVRIKYPRDSFFSKGARSAVFRPAASSVEIAADELHEGRCKLLLAFDLPRGCYATVLLKQLTAPWTSPDPDCSPH